VVYPINRWYHQKILIESIENLLNKMGLGGLRGATPLADLPMLPYLLRRCSIQINWIEYEISYPFCILPSRNGIQIEKGFIYRDPKFEQVVQEEQARLGQRDSHPMRPIAAAY